MDPCFCDKPAAGSSGHDIKQRWRNATFPYANHPPDVALSRNQLSASIFGETPGDDGTGNTPPDR